MAATRVVVSTVVTTLTIIVSGVYWRDESSATICTRPSFSPQISTDVPDNGGSIVRRCRTGATQLSAGRAIDVSVGGNTERKTVSAAGAARLSVTGTGRLSPMRTDIESNAHWSNAGGVATIFTSVESM